MNRLEKLLLVKILDYLYDFCLFKGCLFINNSYIATYVIYSYGKHFLFGVKTLILRVFWGFLRVLCYIDTVYCYNTDLYTLLTQFSSELYYINDFYQGIEPSFLSKNTPNTPNTRRWITFTHKLGIYIT